MEYYKILCKDGSVSQVVECSPNYVLDHGQVAATEAEYKKYVRTATIKRAKVKQEKRIIERRMMIKLDNYIENVQKFHEIQPFFYDDAGMFWFWKDNKYRQTDDVDVMNLLDDTLGFMGQTISTRIKSNYLEAFKRVGRKKKPKNAPVKWIQFKNKAYSIKSNKIYTVTPDYFFTNPIPWEIGENENTPTLDKLFKEWVGEKHVKTLYELIAYCAYRDYPIQLLFCLVGCGRNGKGCFLKVIDKFLGEENVTSTSLDLISGHNKSRFESFRLFKQLVALMGETNFGILNNTSLLKQLTGGDKIGFEKKGKDPFTGYNYAKIIIASNSLPTSQDTSDGFFRRWMIIDFPNEFPEGRDITNSIPEAEYSALAKKVIGLLPRLIEDGKFTNQGDIEERKQRFIESSNPLPMFIQKCCKVHPGEFILYNEFYSAYIHFLRDLKKRKVSRKEFKSALEDEGYWIDREAKKFWVNEEVEWRSGYYINGIGLILDNLDNSRYFCTRKLHYKDASAKQLQIVQIVQKTDLNQKIMVIIEHLANKNGPTVPVEDVIKTANKAQIPAEKAEEVIEYLKRTGMLFEPRYGYLSIL